MTRRTGVVIALVWLVSLLLWLRPGLLLPDGGGYYAYLPSTWLDHDLLFFNEWQSFGLIRGTHIFFKDVTATSHLSNHWTAGSAMLWYPAFVLGDLLRAVVPSLHRFARNGMTLPYNVPVVVTSAAAGLAVLLMGAAIAERRFGRGPAVMAAVGVWFGSPLMWYSLRDATMSHAIAAAACVAIVLLSMRLRDHISYDLLFATGLAIGFAAAVRPQNAVFILVPYLVVGGQRLSQLVRGSWLIALGGLVAALPQLVASSAIYGTPLAFVNVGGSGNNWHALERMWLWQTLFSSYHGMFFWTPLLAVSVVGFAALRRSDRGLGNAAVATFVLQWLINSILDRTFWGGSAFGQRRFDGCTIFFLLALAAVFSRLPRWAAAALTAAGCAWTMSLFFATRQLDLNAYQTAGELWEAQTTALRRLSIGVLADVPQAARTDVLLLVAITILALALAAFAAHRLGVRGGTIVVTAWIAIVAAGFALCARNDESHAVAWKVLIEANRRSAAPSGAKEAELEMLHQEWVYLQRTGHAEQAERTRADAMALAARRHP